MTREEPTFRADFSIRRETVILRKLDQSDSPNCLLSENKTRKGDRLACLSREKLMRAEIVQGQDQLNKLILGSRRI